MVGIGEYHAKWNKPSPKNQKPNVFPDKWRMIYNGVRGGEWEKNEGNLGYVEGNEREWGMKYGGMRQTSLPYIHVWLHEWCESTLCTTIEMKWCTPFVWMNPNAVFKVKKESMFPVEVMTMKC